MKGRGGIARAIRVTAAGKRIVDRPRLRKEDPENAAKRDIDSTQASQGASMKQQLIPVQNSFREWRKDPRLRSRLRRARRRVRPGISPDQGTKRSRLDPATGRNRHGNHPGSGGPPRKRQGAAFHPQPGPLRPGHPHAPPHHFRASPLKVRPPTRPAATSWRVYRLRRSKIKEGYYLCNLPSSSAPQPAPARSDSQTASDPWSPPSARTRSRSSSSCPLPCCNRSPSPPRYAHRGR